MTKTLLLYTAAVIITLLCVKPTHAAITVNVSVEGVDGDIKKNVLALLSIERQKKHQDLTESLLKKLHNKAPDEIRQALQPFGYYRPDIRAELVLKESVWHALYRISPGNPVVIESVEVSIIGEGRDHRRFKKLLRTFPLVKGDILNHQKYEETKRLLHDTASDFGFLKAHMVISKVEVHAEKGVADVMLHFDTGPQFRLGKVTFIQDAFDEKFLARYIPFTKGDPYVVSRIFDLQNALNNSDYFESVDVTPLIEQTEGLEVPINVTLIPRKKYKYTFGVGYGTDTGFRGSVGWDVRRVTKTGQQFGLTIKASEIKSSIIGEYAIPLKKPRTDRVVFATGWLQEETDTSESDKLFAGVQVNHMVKGWKQSLYLNYEKEDFEVADDKGRTSLLIPGISWTRIRADNPVNTKRGLRIYLDIRGAHESFLSDTSFLQLRTQLKFIRRLWRHGRIIMRGEGGTSVVSEFSELPPSVRFFAGGDHSVRGYEYDSLGPENDKGEVTGGKHLLVGSIEYEQQIRGNWGVAVFYDIGNAFDSFSDDMKSGAGFGLRWKSPVGPVRIDLAFPLSSSDKDWRIHLVVGPDL